MDLSYDNVVKQIESFVFYGPHDEFYDQWCNLCRLCADYAQYGEPTTTRVAILLQWIAEDAEESLKQAKDLLERGLIEEIKEENGKPY